MHPPDGDLVEAEEGPMLQGMITVNDRRLRMALTGLAMAVMVVVIVVAGIEPALAFGCSR